MKKKLADNIKLLNIIEQLVHEFPDMRFIQLLTTVDVILGTDQFYEESEITLKRIKEQIKYQQTRYDRLTNINTNR